jgi:hypothetical protein
MFRDGILVIDSTYQRRSVWGERDKIRLIETILLNLVIPELFFWKASTDPESGESITHIVDGQQRVNAVIDFIDGKFKLKESYLLNKETKERWANKTFAQLLPEDKTTIWNYKFMIIEIDPNASRDDIIKMFRRLNLTDYNLNDQERRNSTHGEFAVLARELSENPFWDSNRLFNTTDIKRMKDIEFCATIILLSRNGIIDQTDQKALNQAYEDFQENYKDAVNDKETILKAIEIVSWFINDDTKKFLQRKAQLYTLFSIAFYSMRESKDLGDLEKIQFKIFVSLYEKFDNEFELPEQSTNEHKFLFDLLKRYKLASSEGLNKSTNRMIRFTVLKTFLLELTQEQKEAQESLRELLIAENAKIPEEAKVIDDFDSEEDT